MKRQAPRQAIALSYDGQNAPNLTAKGDDELAEAILKLAREHEVPIYENAELVRLLARMELGDSIPEELYRTIAEIIAFAWKLKGKFPAGYELRDDILERAHRADHDLGAAIHACAPASALARRSISQRAWFKPASAAIGTSGRSGAWRMTFCCASIMARSSSKATTTSR